MLASYPERQECAEAQITRPLGTEHKERHGQGGVLVSRARDIKKLQLGILSRNSQKFRPLGSSQKSSKIVC